MRKLSTNRLDGGGTRLRIGGTGMDVEGRFIDHGWIGIGDMNGED